MLSYIDKIKEISARLLKECQVEMVIGFRKGTVPMMNEPHFAKSAEWALAAGAKWVVWAWLKSTFSTLEQIGNHVPRTSQWRAACHVGLRCRREAWRRLPALN